MADFTTSVRTTFQRVAADIKSIRTRLSKVSPETLDLRTASNRYMNEFDKLGELTVMQTACKDPVSGEWYVSQAIGSGLANGETTVITRLNAMGGYISKMTCTLAGHGTVIEIRRISNVVWVYMSWPTTDGTGATTSNDLVRVRYRDNVTQAKADATNVVVINDFSTGYTSCTIDAENNWVYIRDSTSTVDKYTRRKLSELDAGVNATYGVIDGISLTEFIMQGATSCGDFLYHLEGTSSAANQISVYSYVTGQLVYRYNVDALGYSPDNTLLGAYKEPEGLSLYRDLNGRVSILVGFTVGGGSARTYRMYSIGEANEVEQQVDALAYITPIAKNATCRTPGNITDMRQLKRPGWYYMTGTQFPTMVDRPTGATASAHYLLVSGWDPTGVSGIQVLFRNTATATEANHRMYWRTVNFGAGTAGPWLQFSLTAASAPAA